MKYALLNYTKAQRTGERRSGEMHPDVAAVLERPDVSGGETVDRNVLLVAITADDRIFFDGQEIRLDQVALLVRQASFSSDQALIIQADKRTSHGMFAQVYAEGRRAGIENVQFATARSNQP